MAIQTTQYVVERLIGSRWAHVVSADTEVQARKWAAQMPIPHGDAERLVERSAVTLQTGDAIEAELLVTQPDTDGVDHVVGRRNVRGVVTRHSENHASISNPYVAINPVVIDGASGALRNIRVVG